MSISSLCCKIFPCLFFFKFLNLKSFFSFNKYLSISELLITFDNFCDNALEFFLIQAYHLVIRYFLYFPFFDFRKLLIAFFTEKGLAL